MPYNQSVRARVISATRTSHTIIPNIPQSLILVMNALRVLLAYCKKISLILLIHVNDIKTKPGYKWPIIDLVR